eukprot:1955251-Pleurochrysis_carterae.AAC.1
MHVALGMQAGVCRRHRTRTVHTAARERGEEESIGQRADTKSRVPRAEVFRCGRSHERRAHARARACAHASARLRERTCTEPKGSHRCAWMRGKAVA